MKALKPPTLKVFIRLLYNPVPLELTELEWEGSEVVAFLKSLPVLGLDGTLLLFYKDTSDTMFSPEDTHIEWTSRSRLSDNYPDTFSGFYLKTQNKLKLSKFLDNYIAEFEKGNLIYDKNYCSYDNHIRHVRSLWENQFIESGAQIVVSDRDIVKISNEIRLYELVLSLNKKGSLDIVSCDYHGYGTDYTINTLLLNVKFKQSPKEISGTYKGGAHHKTSRLMGQVRDGKVDEVEIPHDTQDKKEQPDDIVYTLIYTGQDLSVKGTFLDKKGRQIVSERKLARPDFDSENYRVISFLMDHPNKRYTREALQKELSQQENDAVVIKKTFPKIAENLGFKGDWLKIFIKASKKGVCLTNPITRKDLSSLGISYLPLKG